MQKRALSWKFTSSSGKSFFFWLTLPSTELVSQPGASCKQQSADFCKPSRNLPETKTTTTISFEGVCCVYSRNPGSSAWFLASVLRSVTAFPGNPGIGPDEFPNRTFLVASWRQKKKHVFGTRIGLLHRGEYDKIQKPQNLETEIDSASSGDALDTGKTR